MCALFSVWCGVQLNCVLISTCSGEGWGVAEGVVLCRFCEFWQGAVTVRCWFFPPSPLNDWCFLLQSVVHFPPLAWFLVNIVLIVFCCQRGGLMITPNVLISKSPATKQPLACMWKFFFCPYSWCSVLNFKKTILTIAFSRSSHRLAHLSVLPLNHRCCFST